VHIRADEGDGGVLHRTYPSHTAAVSLPSLMYALHLRSISHYFPDGLDVPNLKKTWRRNAQLDLHRGCHDLHADIVHVGEGAMPVGEGNCGTSEVTDRIVIFYKNIKCVLNIHVIYISPTIFPILSIIFNDRLK
jgi:hypothetical protein